MIKQTINPENWVDTSVEISYNEDRSTLHIYGDVYRVISESEESTIKRLVDVDGKSIALLYYEMDDAAWVVKGNTLTFIDNNYMIACAKLIANIT